MSEEKKEEKENKPDEKECAPCKIAGGVVASLDICRLAQEQKEKKIDCKDLAQQVISGKLKPFEVTAKLKEAFKDDKDVLEDLEITEMLMQGKSEEEITRKIEEAATKR